MPRRPIIGEKECKKCGAVFQYRSSLREFCDDCGPNNKPYDMTRTHQQHKRPIKDKLLPPPVVALPPREYVKSSLWANAVPDWSIVHRINARNEMITLDDNKPEKPVVYVHADKTPARYDDFYCTS